MSLALRAGLFSSSSSSSNLARRPLLAAAASAALWNSAPFRFALPSWTSLLEFFPSILWAVPKKKVSHSRKAMRAANKGLTDKNNIVNCAGCGSAKLAHHLCPNCYSEISRGYKQAQREAEASRDH